MSVKVIEEFKGRDTGQVCRCEGRILYDYRHIEITRAIGEPRTGKMPTETKTKKKSSMYCEDCSGLYKEDGERFGEFRADLEEEREENKEEAREVLSTVVRSVGSDGFR